VLPPSSEPLDKAAWSDAADKLKMS
jgi:hypothetical protein